MPDVLIILIALVGLFFIGLAFSAINLVKDATRFIAISLLMVFVILMANRTFSFSDLTGLPAARPPAATNGATGEATRPFPYARSTGDFLTRLRANIGNTSDAIDTFVYGPEARIGWNRLPEKLPVNPAQTSQPKPIPAPEQTISSPRTDRPPPAAQSPSASRPVSAWW